MFGKVFVIGHKPGMAQTMKLANNFLSATAMAATSEAVAMGVKAGLDPAVMIDVINAGSGRSTASTDKFPQDDPAAQLQLRIRHRADAQGCAALRRGGEILDVPNDVMSAVLDQWEATNSEFGGDTDFTVIAQMIERRAGVTVGAKK